MLSYDNPVVPPVNSQSVTAPLPPPTATAADLTADRAPAAPAHQPGTAPMISTGTADATMPVQNGTANNGLKHIPPHHIWLVTGPAGVGKTSVAQFLARELNMPYIEGDEYHPEANIKKMSSGIPLTDADRWDWLTVLREESVRQLRERDMEREKGQDGARGVVLTCSALKRKYRDVIRVAPYFDHAVVVHFIYLSADPALLLERVQRRTNHYMGPGMVQSQFDILEEPQADETDIISIDVSRTLDEVQHDALGRVLAIMNAETGTN